MSQNAELLTLVAFGAAALLGVAGGPIWIAVAIGVVYGVDALVSPRESSASGKEGGQATVQQPSSTVALRMAVTLLTYGAGLALRLLGNA